MNVLAVAIWLAVTASSVLLLLGLHRSRPPSAGGGARLHDLSEAAFMAGGPGAVVDSALVSLLDTGRLIAGGPGIVQAAPGARAGDPAERAVLLALRQAPSGWLYQVRYAAMVDPSVQETGDALAARGLISPPGSGRPWRRWGVVQAVVCGALVPLSLPLTFVAWALTPGPQVPFALKVLPALVAGIVLGATAAARARKRITPAGRAALAEMRARYLNDRTPHVQTALFGLAGLRDPGLRALLVPAARSTRLAAAQARTRPHTSGAAASSGASCASGSSSSSGSSVDVLPVVWCATSDSGSSGSGCGGGGSSCGSSGSGCGSSSSGCGSSGSSCGSSSSSCGSSGSSCGSSSSSCGSSSSSCGSSSSSCSSSS